MSKIKDGLTAIASEVLEDVKKEAEAIILKAEKEAKSNLRVAKEEAERDYEVSLNDAKTKAEAERKRIVALTEVETRNRLLQTKETLVNVAFEKAWIKTVAFTKTGEYPSYLISLIVEAAKRINQKKLNVYLTAEDKQKLTKTDFDNLTAELQAQLSFLEIAGEYIGGCKVESEDGRIVYDNTIENRFLQLKPSLRLEVAVVLFAKEGEGDAR